MKTKIPALLLFFLAALLLSVRAQSPAQDQKIREVENGLVPNAVILFADSVIKHFNIEERMHYYNIPSISIAVINNGKIAWAKAYGLADVTDNRKADTHTLYQAASISKSINALCIIKLAQDGKLDLDKDIRIWLKTWTFPDNDLSKGKTITLKNLLSHTAGLSTGGFRGYLKGDSLPTTNQILDGMHPANSDAVKPTLVPGTATQYSGGGTLVTKKILMDNISADYAGLIKRTVLQPLGMTGSTFVQPLPVHYKNFAVAYDINKKEMAGKYYIYPEQAPDGLWTNPTDYAKFILAMQQSLKEDDGFLNKKMANEMITPVLEGSDAALGVFIKEKGGEKYFTHTGANMGYRSIYYGSFNTGNGVVLLINSDNDKILDELVNSVAVAYNWKGFYNPEVRKLVKLLDTLTNHYIGEYQSDQPALTIKIIRKNGELQLSARDNGNFERMYFIGNDSFFLMSSPYTLAAITTADDGKTYNLVVKQGDKVLITARKIN
jgi:CubicO group peptidase (beta-lactamase class C family)